jgi:hypothetical protein
VRPNVWNAAREEDLVAAAEAREPGRTVSSIIGFISRGTPEDDDTCSASRSTR